VPEFRQDVLSTDQLKQAGKALGLRDQAVAEQFAEIIIGFFVPKRVKL